MGVRIALTGMMICEAPVAFSARRSPVMIRSDNVTTTAALASGGRESVVPRGAIGVGATTAVERLPFDEPLPPALSCFSTLATIWSTAAVSSMGGKLLVVSVQLSVRRRAEMKEEFSSHQVSD